MIVWALWSAARLECTDVVIIVVKIFKVSIKNISVQVGISLLSRLLLPAPTAHAPPLGLLAHLVTQQLQGHLCGTPRTLLQSFSQCPL